MPLLPFDGIVNLWFENISEAGSASSLSNNELNTLQLGSNIATKFFDPFHVKMQAFTSNIISTNVIIVNGVNSKCLYLLVDRLNECIS